MENPFLKCLAGLNEAQDAMFDDKGLGAYGEWARAHTGLLQVALTTMAKTYDERQSSAEKARRAADGDDPGAIR